MKTDLFIEKVISSNCHVVKIFAFNGFFDILS